MNIKEIKEVINLMNENNLTEIELEKDGLKIRLKKGFDGSIEMTERIHHGGITAKTQNELPRIETRPEPETVKTLEIKSPMVGTFYKAATPDSPSFVKVGDKIEIGQVVCIIEAMKLMNEIKSEIKGKVVSCHVENADPVEFGHVLFSVEPA